MFSALKKLVLGTVLLATLSACYLPARFDAEIEVSRTGYYDIIFDGYLVNMTMFDKLMNGELSAQEEEDWVERVRNDLIRPSKDERYKSPASGFQYFGKAHFKIHWEKEGDLTAARSVSFLRPSRNEQILTLKFIRNDMKLMVTPEDLNPDDDVTPTPRSELVKGPFIIFEGKSMKKETRDRIYRSGLNSVGEIRLKTDAKMYDHNATEVKDDPQDARFKWYTWKVESIHSKTPKAVMQLR